MEEEGKQPEQEQVDIAVCIPARDEVHTWFAYSLTLADSYLAAKYDYVRTHLIISNGTLIQEQRTDLAKKAMQAGCSWIIYCDSDMRFPKNAFEELLKHKKPIVGANYATRKYPFIQTVTYRSDESDERVYTTPESEGLEEVASTGFGLMAVHRMVFEAMEQPWFFVPYDTKNNRFDCGEDIWFCRRAREAGFPVYIDHDLSKAVYHIGTMDWSHNHAVSLQAVAKHKTKLQKDDSNCIDMSNLDGQQSAA